MIFDYNFIKKKLAALDNTLESPEIWKNKNIAKELNKKYFSSKNFINCIDTLYIKLLDLNNLLTLTKAHDNMLLTEIYVELIDIEKELSQLEIDRMFLGKHDNTNCYIDIQSGSGGIDAQDWAGMLRRMYLRWIENRKFVFKIIEESIGEISGIKSTTVKIMGDYVYGWLRGESGVHRLVRKSPFDAGKRRHTSFASVFVYPELDDNIKVNIRIEDLRCDVYRASGAGGQHVNRTESAVRITHIPTNIVTQCQNERSQHKNKSQAMKQLKAKLYAFELRKKNNEKKIIENDKLDITWGNQIRSYVLDDSRVKDLRTGLEKRNVKAILDGDLDDFILVNMKREKSSARN